KSQEQNSFRHIACSKPLPLKTRTRGKAPRSVKRDQTAGLWCWLAPVIRPGCIQATAPGAVAESPTFAASAGNLLQRLNVPATGSVGSRLARAFAHHFGS